MPYYTDHKYNGTHRYVCVYTLPDGYVTRILYYALYKYEDAHHYVCVDEL
jgi:hypothetical protein